MVDNVPLVTLPRQPFKNMLVQMTSSDKEVYGYLIGKPTRMNCYRVYHIFVSTTATSTEDGVFVDWEDEARARELFIKLYAPSGLVGYFHSHPYKMCGAEALAPQISDQDKATTSDGDIEVITAVFPKLERKLKSTYHTIIRTIGDYMTSTEAWLRKGDRFIRCRIVTR